MQPFMDRPQKPINRLSGAIFKITREPLKLRRHVKHCKKVFEQFFQQSLNKGTFTFENFGKNGCLYFPEVIFSNFCYLQKIGLNSLQVQQGTTDVKKCQLTLFGGNNLGGDKYFWKILQKAILRILRQNCCQ